MNNPVRRNVPANILQRGAAESQHPSSDTSAHQPSWDDIRVFMACAERESFRQAANDLRLNSSTVVRRIERLETALKSRLFDRLPDGVALTNAGKALATHGRRMEQAAFDAIRTGAQFQTERHSVTVSITEGLGSYWMMRHLVRFQRQYPQMLVNMRCAMENADVLRLEADMAVQFERPTNPDLIVVRLCRLHIYPFASQEYLETYGIPSSLADMTRHRIVNQVAPQIDPKAWARNLSVKSIEPMVGIATNASTAILYAVENGAGIGALPTYVGIFNRDIVPVDVGKHHAFDTWLTYHPDVRKDQHKAYLIDWIRRIFDPHQYPWFGDEFIHPAELRARYGADTV